MKRHFLFLISCALFLFSAKSFADNSIKPHNQNGTYLNISATSNKDVEEDLIIANLRFEANGTSSQRVQEEINKAISSAIKKASLFSDIKISTEQYSVYQYYPPTKKGEIKKRLWRGNQGILLKGKNKDTILKLTGDLQKMGLVISKLDYIVSFEKNEAVRDALMEVALAKLYAKARRVANAIGKENNAIKMLTINIDSNNHIAPARYRNNNMMSAELSKDFVSPSIAPGLRKISMNVSATILIED